MILSILTNKWIYIKNPNYINYEDNKAVYHRTCLDN